MAKGNRWLVRVETAQRGYLKVSSKHMVFKTENGAWNYIERMRRKHPECECFIGEIESATVRKPKLDLKDTVGADGIDF